MKALLAYLFSEHRQRNFVKKLYVFFNTVDETSFTQDTDLEILYAMVWAFVKMNVEENVENSELLGQRVLNLPKYKDDTESILGDAFDILINEEMATYVENEFIDRLNYAAVVPVVGQMKAAISRFDKNEFESFQQAVEDIRMHTTVFNKAVNMRSSNALTYPEVDFNSPQFDDILVKVHKNLTNPKRFVKTGIKRLNDMINGGFQPGRVYVFMAVSGGFKSGLLLNMFLWGPKYNRNIRCRDQAKKPMYLYITQENDTEETLDRMFSYIRCAKNGEHYESIEKIKEAFREEGIIDCDTHGIKIMYFQKNSLCANDMENIVRDIESDGEYEVKLIVHDYLKRLKPNVPANDIRLDLGNATNDLSELSKLLKLPIITANQLNREAYNTMAQQGNNEHKNDLGKKASLTMQSESQMISENADVVIAINQEYLKALDEWFLTFTDLKNRAAKSKKSYNKRYFATPFEKGNSMRLQEDEGTDEDYSIDSVTDILEKYDPNARPSIDEEEDDGQSSGGQSDDSDSKPKTRKKGQRSRININDAFDEDDS
jgi:replicative DNA helicase